jgi:hypothetical protein
MAPWAYRRKHGGHKGTAAVEYFTPKNNKIRCLSVHNCRKYSSIHVQKWSRRVHAKAGFSTGAEIGWIRSWDFLFEC